MTFPERLRAARLQRGLTQRQVGDAIGLSETAVTGYESGYSTPRFDTIAPLCRVLGVSSDWLLAVELPSPTTERATLAYAERVLDAVSIAFETSREQIMGRRRYARAVAARHAAMWILLEHTGMSLKEVGRVMGGLDHSSVVHGRNNVASWSEYAAPLWGLVQIALSILGSSRAPAVRSVRASHRDPGSESAEGDRAPRGQPGASYAVPLFQPLTREAA